MLNLKVFLFGKNSWGSRDKIIIKLPLTFEKCTTYITCGTQAFAILWAQELLHVFLYVFFSLASESFLLITQSHTKSEVWGRTVHKHTVMSLGPRQLSHTSPSPHKPPVATLIDSLLPSSHFLWEDLKQEYKMMTVSKHVPRRVFRKH